MRTGMSLILAAAARKRLEALIGGRNTVQKQVWRAEIVLPSPDGVGTKEIIRRTGASKTCLRRWQA